MYYRQSSPVGQPQDALNPAPAGIERSHFGHTPEAARLMEIGHEIDWLRTSAVITGQYNVAKVNELSPLTNQDTIINYFGQTIFGPKQSEPISTQERTRQLLDAEAKLGGQIPKQEEGVTQEFFAFNPEQWMHYSHTTQKFGLLNLGAQNKTTELSYKVRGGNIQKFINGSHIEISDEEVGKLLKTADYYVEFIGKTIYPELYQYYEAWQASERARQIADRAVNAANQKHPGDFAVAA